MLAHAAQVQHHHLQPQRLPMGQQHGLSVNPHFRQSGSVGVPQQQPRYSHHLQQQQGGGKVRGGARGGARGGGGEGQGEGKGKGREGAR